MSEPLVQENSVQALARLSDGLAAYKEVSGKLSSAILAQKGAQLIFGNQNPKFGALFDGLVQLFFNQIPGQGQIWEAARRRGFRVGRRQYGGGLSPRAIARAKEMMGGFKSILVTSQAGTRLNFVRSGVRKKRVHYRWGRKSTAVAGNDKSRRSAEHPINLRAVATFFELQKREQGRRFLGAGFLQRRWRKLAKLGLIPEGTPGLTVGWAKSRQFGGTERKLVNINPRSEIQPLGSLEFEGSEKSGDMALRITSFVPGTMTVGDSRGLFVRAINGVRADLDEYVARKHAELLAQAMQSGGKAA